MAPKLRHGDTWRYRTSQSQPLTWSSDRHLEGYQAPTTVPWLPYWCWAIMSNDRRTHRPTSRRRYHVIDHVVIVCFAALPFRHTARSCRFRRTLCRGALACRHMAYKKMTSHDNAFAVIDFFDHRSRRNEMRRRFVVLTVEKYPEIDHFHNEFHPVSIFALIYWDMCYTHDKLLDGIFYWVSIRQTHWIAISSSRNTYPSFYSVANEGVAGLYFESTAGSFYRSNFQQCMFCCT